MCKINSSLHLTKRAQMTHNKDTDAHWAPNTDVYVTDDGLVIKVELAGMRREDLELTIEGNRLRISGQRPDGSRGPKCKFLVMEIHYGSFESVIDVPEGYDPGQARASYQNGFLRIDVPAVAHAVQKKLSTGLAGR